MSYDAPTGLTEPFWTFCQVLSSFAAKQIVIVFSRSEWAAMLQMA